MKSRRLYLLPLVWSAGTPRRTLDTYASLYPDLRGLKAFFLGRLVPGQPLPD